MGAGGKGEVGTSRNGKAAWDDDDIDFGDDDDDLVELSDLRELGEVSLTKLCRKASSGFFRQYGLISHQIDSYNEFVKHGVQRVFDSIGQIAVEPGYDPSRKRDAMWRYASIRFGKVTLERPMFWTGEKFQKEGGKDSLPLFPWHARMQNMTYSARMKVKTFVQIYTQKMVQSDKFKTGKEQYLHKEILSEEECDVLIGRVPVMVKSDICWTSESAKDDCHFDHGGYFIVKGAEKCFIAQEQVCLKRLWITNDQYWKIAYRPSAKMKRVTVKLVEDDQTDCIPSGEKVLRVYCLLVEVPIWIIFFALGVSSDKEVVELIGCDIDDGRIQNILIASIHDADDKCEGFRNKDTALSYLENKLKHLHFPPSESANTLIGNSLFSNLKGSMQKARFLGYMVKCLLEALSGRRKCDNRDDFRNKRFDLACELLERELYVHVKHAERRMAKAMQKDLYADRDLQPLEHYLDASIITNGLSRAFSTGAWAHPYIRSDRISGVVANLRRTNPLQMTSDLRRTRQQVSYTGKVGDARYPHPSHWGKVCFLSTPDGENCGLVKNIAITGLVSTSVVEPVLDKLVSFGMEILVDDACTSLKGKDKVLLDGEWVGVCANSLSFAKQLRRRRRRNELPSQVEIKRDGHHGEVRIWCDSGRILRPLLVVENLRKINSLKGDDYSFQSLLDKGIIEFIGPEEEEDCCTAWGIKYLLVEGDGRQPVKYTHCELDLSFLLGLSCGIIPFANHDHARRVLYQSQKHCQQAIGFGSTNPNVRVDTLSQQLFYPQRPLFRTATSDCLGKPGHPPVHKYLMQMPEFFNGQNAIVAVNVHLGYNQEDSIVMNRASLERGMFRSEHVRSYKAEVDTKESDKRRKLDDWVTFGKVQSKIGRVDSLDDDGFPYIGANLQNGDIIIGRCAESGADHSVKLKYTEKGMVQKVVLSANDDGKNYAVVALRQVRSPCLGDKFSSMHGQKGVLGFLEAQENFPFTRDGIVPDIVINPHAFPSRQTPGQLLEAALGKGIACGGSLKAATPFSSLSVESITDQLHRAGFCRWGNERVYNGRTGEMTRSLIFMGPNFYQRLIHMSEDKVKFRNTGPVHPLTRQPVADRKRFGGIKFGEMERDCLIAHGAAANLHERLFTLSDQSQMHICQKCQNVSNVIQRAVQGGGRKVRGPYCRFCESADDIVRVNVPYGAKLLYQELFSMGIALKFETRAC